MSSSSSSPSSSSSSSSDEGPIHMREDFLQIIVVGEPGCGKTSFIQECYNNNSLDEAYSFNGAEVYPCKIELKTESRNVALLEFLELPLTLEERKPHYLEPDAIVFMYAIDDPSSLKAAVDKWLEEVADVSHYYCCKFILLGNKIDLQDDQLASESLAHKNQRLLTSENVKEYIEDFRLEKLTFLECSAIHIQSVLKTIRIIIMEIDRAVQKFEDDF